MKWCIIVKKDHEKSIAHIFIGCLFLFDFLCHQDRSTTGPVKSLYISGQIGEGEGLEAQMRSVLANLEKQLAEGGATFKDIVKMNTYIVDYKPSDLDIFRGVRKEIMGDKDMPASTLVGVHSLALEQWLIEMEAVAVVEIDPWCMSMRVLLFYI